jgi:nucleotide-binding universal stress UspA family protein
MHVLIGTDGSDDSLNAARQAMPLLATADIVTLVCAAEPPAEASSGLESGFAGGVVSPVEVEVGWTVAQDAARQALERTAEAIAGLAPGSVELVVEAGPAGSVICDLASERGVDVIVVGSRGRGAFKRAVLGSVSTHIVHSAPCPVLVVRAGAI